MTIWFRSQLGRFQIDSSTTPALRCWRDSSSFSEVWRIWRRLRSWKIAQLRCRVRNWRLDSHSTTAIWLYWMKRVSLSLLSMFYFDLFRLLVLLDIGFKMGSMWDLWRRNCGSNWRQIRLWTLLWISWAFWERALCFWRLELFQPANKEMFILNRNHWVLRY